MGARTVCPSFRNTHNVLAEKIPVDPSIIHLIYEHVCDITSLKRYGQANHRQQQQHFVAKKRQSAQRRDERKRWTKREKQKIGINGRMIDKLNVLFN